MIPAIVLAATLYEGGAGGVSVRMDSDTERIDPGRSVELTLTVSSPKGKSAEPPDLRPRLRGFSLAEFFEDAPSTSGGGATSRTVHWLLRPEPCAPQYAVAPFAVEVEGGGSFVAGPVKFAAPAARASVAGDMETSPEKDLPPFGWALAGWCAAALAALAAAAFAVYAAARYSARRIKEHFMSPIERARAELDRLVRKGLPRRGRFKDFYVELTMVARRYIQRKYGIGAPHMTTEEFFAAAGRAGGTIAPAELREFLVSADLVKFAGADATQESSDAAVAAARAYLEKDAGKEARA